MASPSSDRKAVLSAAEGSTLGDLTRRARAWIDDDPDPVTRGELRRVLEAQDAEALRDRFGSELHFGTAGLRGRLGAGPARINQATVRRTTAGLAAHLKAEVPRAAEAGVVIGHDARHGSARFAEEAGGVLTGAGIRALRLRGNVPTPLVAYAVRRLGCAAGIMITASHNPPADNGYKVFLGDGAQVAPPADEQIASRINAVQRLSEVPLGGEGEWLGAAVREAYLKDIVAALPAQEAVSFDGADTGVPLRIVYSPLHGVGGELLLDAFTCAGFPRPRVVAAQSDPDPDFPTVERPNPEEPGTLDLVLAEARDAHADLMLANDPDADRLAVALPEADGDDWRVLDGDEVGALLALHLLEHCDDPDRVVLVSTVASSTLLESMAEVHGVAYRRTLTGFKWIMRAAAEAAPKRLLLAYEEALGYAVNGVVRDKDGISAALLLCQAAISARRSGVTLVDRLDELACRFGLHATRQVSIELPGERGSRATAEIMRRLRSDPPASLGGRPVSELRDLSVGEPPNSDVLVLGCEDGTRAVVRPSGTEPKLKIYLQVVLPMHRPQQTRQQAALELDGIEHEMCEVTRV